MSAQIPHKDLKQVCPWGRGDFLPPRPKSSALGSMVSGREGCLTHPWRGHSAQSMEGRAQSGWYKKMNNIAGIYYWKHIKANIWLSVYLLVELFKWLNGAQESAWRVWLKTNWVSVSPQLWTWGVSVSLALECPLGSVPQLQTVGREPQPGGSSCPWSWWSQGLTLPRQNRVPVASADRAQGDRRSTLHISGPNCYRGLILLSQKPFHEDSSEHHSGDDCCRSVFLFPCLIFSSLLKWSLVLMKRMSLAIKSEQLRVGKGRTLLC